ncbi:PspA/IM30 family protein [Timonella senegalensis]|uniref:PspA/IM30 family protein n=2 Tax=Timonella senegalensis TaxID=1465825 RepID=UPI0002E8D411|nr:PspA/IM30 family protein [Timonella senegalensis]
MAQKQSIFGRISQLLKANINALIDGAEDPEKMIDQLVRDYTNQIAEAEQAIATTIGNLRLAEQDYNEDVNAVKEWGQKALAASQRGDSFRSQGNTTEADRFDNLAKVALERQVQAESEVKTAQPMIDSQRDTVEKLKMGLGQMKEKLNELKNKRDSLVARDKSAKAQQQVQSAISNINVLDPTSEISRFEERVRREEAKALGQQEIAASSIEAQFKDLEVSAESIEVENRLAALKAGNRAAPEIESTYVTEH